jgi:hypothetical protein
MVFVAGIATTSTISSATIQITDVVGLTNELILRPTMGAGYGTGRTAVINSSGQVEAAAGNLGDCVHVDGTSGPCSSPTISNVPNFVDADTLQGAANGSNTTFTLSRSAISGSVHLFVNGIRMRPGLDFTCTGNVIMFMTNSVPPAGATLLADYRY